MNRFLLFSGLLIVFLFFSFPTFGATEVDYPSFLGISTPQEIITTAEIEAEIFPLFMAYIFRILIFISVVVLVGVIVYAGLLYLLSTGNPARTKMAREWILSAMQGALIIFSSYALLFALDSQLVLFELREIDKANEMDRVPIEWELRNSYYQIPMGLIVEDAVLNENAQNKFYDVLDATNEAEAVAEAIYQGSKQLLSIIESCPAGMECGGGGSFSGPSSISFSSPSPAVRASQGFIPPASTDPSLASQSQQQSEDTSSQDEEDYLVMGEDWVPENNTRTHSQEEREEITDILEEDILTGEEARRQFYEDPWEFFAEREAALSEYDEDLVLSVEAELLANNALDKIHTLLIDQPPNYERLIGELLSETNSELLKILENRKDISLAGYWQKKDAEAEATILLDAIDKNLNDFYAQEIYDALASIDEESEELYSLSGGSDSDYLDRIDRERLRSDSNYVDRFVRERIDELASARTKKIEDLKNLFENIATHPDFEYFYQADSRWGDVAYGSKYTADQSACIPVSAAMSLTPLVEGVSPEEIIDFAKNNPELMFNENLYPALAEKYDVGITKAASREDVFSALERGDSVNIFGNGDPFNSSDGSSGHAMVLTGINYDKDLIHVRDPFFPENKRVIPISSLRSFSAAWVFDNSSLYDVPSPPEHDPRLHLHFFKNYLASFFDNWRISSVFALDDWLDVRNPGTGDKKERGSVSDFDQFYGGDDHWQRGVRPDTEETTTSETRDPDTDGTTETQPWTPDVGDDYLDEALREEDYDGDSDIPPPPEEDYPDEEEEETPEDELCCPPCPNIASAVQAKIAEIEGYMGQLPGKLQAMLGTKEPLKEDLYNLYKALMLKSLGSRHVFDYNSLLLEKRHQDRDDTIILTDEEEREIGDYYWGWEQWVNNTLYQIKVDDQIVEENDPATFYIRYSDQKNLIEDALSLAKDARGDIQRAGDLVGVPEETPPTPPDIGTSLFAPVSPNPIRMTSPYGWRHDPFTGSWVMHRGIDFGGPRNTPIYASESGEVVFAGWAGTENTGYGKLIVLYHRATPENDLEEDVVTYYAHLNQGSLQVKVGDRVKRGEYLAGMGTTGRSTGYHIHYEVRNNVSYPYQMYTGNQVDPGPYIAIERWSTSSSPLKNYYSFKHKNSPFLAKFDNLLSLLLPSTVSAQEDLTTFIDYLEQEEIDYEDLSQEEIEEISQDLGIEIPSDNIFDVRDVNVMTPGDYLTCGMEIPIGETFEISWVHLVEILDKIDDYVSEGERLLEQQRVMNSLASGCSCPCVGDCCDCMCVDEDGNEYPCPTCGACNLTCNLPAIKSAHSNVAQTRAIMQRIANDINTLTHGFFNTLTEDVCHRLNEDIRSEEERVVCSNGGSKLITKHELITRKLNYSRFEFDECITRPEHLEETQEGVRPGKVTYFGPLVEERDLPRQTKTKENNTLVNTNKFNWFCCSDSRNED